MPGGPWAAKNCRIFEISFDIEFYAEPALSDDTCELTLWEHRYISPFFISPPLSRWWGAKKYRMVIMSLYRIREIKWVKNNSRENRTRNCLICILCEFRVNGLLFFVLCRYSLAKSWPNDRGTKIFSAFTLRVQRAPERWCDKLEKINANFRATIDEDPLRADILFQLMTNNFWEIELFGRESMDRSLFWRRIFEIWEILLLNRKFNSYEYCSQKFHKNLIFMGIIFWPILATT